LSCHLPFSRAIFESFLAAMGAWQAGGVANDAWINQLELQAHVSNVSLARHEPIPKLPWECVRGNDTSENISNTLVRSEQGTFPECDCDCVGRGHRLNCLYALVSGLHDLAKAPIVGVSVLFTHTAPLSPAKCPKPLLSLACTFF